MKLIEPSIELIQESNPYKLIERIGRTCYKSESAIIEDSCYTFVDRLIKRQHFAMLEHARFNFKLVGYRFPVELLNIPGLILHTLLEETDDAWILNVSMSHLYNPKWYAAAELFDVLREMVETHYKYNKSSISKRLVFNNVKLSDERIDSITLIPDIREEDVDDVELQLPDLRYITFKFITDRGTSHELVRHRCAVAQESTRYVDYTKDKFGGELTFIKPEDYDNWIGLIKDEFNSTMKNAESSYQWLVTKGKLTPQIARQRLPHALKTEVILTMSLNQWEHFFNLRYKGTTGSPHPEMKRIAEMAYSIFESLKGCKSLNLNSDNA